MKSLFNKSSRISTDIFIDSNSTKVIYDKMFGENLGRSLKGFVQDISLNPYAFFMMSDMQVKFLIYCF